MLIFLTVIIYITSLKLLIGASVSNEYEWDKKQIESFKIASTKVNKEKLFFSTTLEEYINAAVDMSNTRELYFSTNAINEGKLFFSTTFEEDIRVAVEILSLKVSNWTQKLSSCCLLNSKFMDQRDCFDVISKNLSVSDGEPNLSDENTSQNIGNEPNSFYWSSELAQEFSVIESSETKAQTLVSKSLLDFEDEKRNLSKYVATVTKDKIVEIETEVNMKFSEYMKQTNIKRNEPPVERNASINSEDATQDKKILHETWIDAGYNIRDGISSEVALKIVRALPIKRYRIREDTKADILVSRDVLVSKALDVEERRTRFHLGVLDPDDVLEKILKDETIISALEPSASLWYNLNLKAITTISQIVEKQRLILTTLEELTYSESYIAKRIDILKKNASERIVSRAKIALDVKIKEARAANWIIALLSQKHKHLIQMEGIQFNNAQNLKLLLIKDQRKSRISSAEDDVSGRRDYHKLEAEAFLDMVIEGIQTMGELIIKKWRTQREVSMLHLSAKADALRARNRILDEAQEEREHEDKSLERVKIIGDEIKKEVIGTVHIIFQNIGDATHFLLFTKEGKKQLILLIVASIVLSFSLASSREIINLGFGVIEKFLTTPKLVREYGNIRFKKRSKALLEDVILPHEIKKRLADLCSNISKSRKRGAPFRNLLLYGKAGTGKSMLARAFAESISDIPFAVMSGGDLAPLGRHGPHELKKLLSWASIQQKGGIIIIDDAESALSSRTNQCLSSNIQDEDFEKKKISIDSLNVLLSMTGTNESSNIMLILTSSSPGTLDEAVLDRMDECVELPLSETKEKEAILMQSFTSRFIVSTGPNTNFYKRVLNKIKQYYIGRKSLLAVDECFSANEYIARLAKDEMTNGCSGRELQKIVNAVSNAVYGTDECVLTAKLWIDVTQTICNQMVKKRNL